MYNPVSPFCTYCKPQSNDLLGEKSQFFTLSYSACAYFFVNTLYNIQKVPFHF